MPRVSEEHIDTRKRQIIEAAYRCFARKGLHQTTMRDIYAEAGLSAGAIYSYFKSKEDIIEASFVFDYRRGLPVFERAAEDPDPITALEQLLGFFFAGLQSAAEIGADRVNIQGWGEALVNPRLLAPLQESLRDFRKLLSQLIRRGQAAGAFDSTIDAEAMGEVIFSTYLGLYLQKAVWPELDVERYKAAALALLRSTLIRTP